MPEKSAESEINLDRMIDSAHSVAELSLDAIKEANAPPNYLAAVKTQAHHDGSKAGMKDFDSRELSGIKAPPYVGDFKKATDWEVSQQKVFLPDSSNATVAALEIAFYPKPLNLGEDN